MGKQASNTFVGGLNTDRHPLTAQNTELIDAINIDLLAIGEGYQLILQKREGNSELLITPPAWISTTQYHINEFVVRNSAIYKAVADNKNADPTSSASWEIQTGTKAPAGLPLGFIPLAVKELNNIAYILSVNPTTGEGELGTFPSPDYTKFIYEEGAAIPNTVTIGAPTWDDTVEIQEFGYTLVERAHAGTTELILGDDLAKELTYAGFTITHKGYSPNSYGLSVSTNDATIYYKIDGGSSTLYNSASKPNLYLNQTLEVRFKVADAFVFEAGEVRATTCTITPDNGITDIRTHEFSFNTTFILLIEDPDTSLWSTSVTSNVDVGATPVLSYAIKANSIASTTTLNSPGTVPAWITVTAPSPDTGEILSASRTGSVSFGVDSNIAPPSLARNCTIIIKGILGSATNYISVNINQSGS